MNFEFSNLIGSIGTQKQLFSYWFFLGEEMFPSETQALLRTTLNLLLQKRSDGGIVELATEINTSMHPSKAEKNAKIVIDSFMKEFNFELLRILKNN